MVPLLAPGRFCGRAVRRAHAGSFLLEETGYRPRQRLEAHAHERALLCVVLEGSWRERSGGAPAECVPLDVLYRPPGEVHAQEFGERPARCFSLEIAPEVTARYADHTRALGQRLGGAASPLQPLVARLRRELLEGDALSPLAVEGLWLEIVATAGRARPGRGADRPGWLPRALDYLRAHAAHPVTIADAAAAVEVEPPRFSREFRRAMGCTVAGYLRSVRVKAAERLLLDPGVPGAEVALRVGFYDQSHFCRAFKRETGLTPTEFVAGRGGDRRGDRGPGGPGTSA